MKPGVTRLGQLLPSSGREIWEGSVCPPLTELVDNALTVLDDALGEAEVNRVYRRRFRKTQDYGGLAYEILTGAGLAKIGQNLEAQVPSGVGNATFDWRVRVSGVVANCEVMLITDEDSFPCHRRRRGIRYREDPKARGDHFVSDPRIPRGECADIQDKLRDKVHRQLPADGG